MGLPTTKSDDTQSATPTATPTTTNQTSSNPSNSQPPEPQPAPETQSQTSPDPDSLPPAALDLAAKLFDLARNGDTQTLSQYVSAGIPRNLTNHAGDTLLMLAAYHDHPETVSMLLRHGADADALNARGQSPLAGAVFKGCDGVVRVLAEEGRADPRKGRPSAVECAGMFRQWGLAQVMGVEEEARRLAEGGLDPVGAASVGYGGAEPGQRDGGGSGGAG